MSTHRGTTTGTIRKRCSSGCYSALQRLLRVAARFVPVGFVLAGAGPPLISRRRRKVVSDVLLAPSPIGGIEAASYSRPPAPQTVPWPRLDRRINRRMAHGSTSTYSRGFRYATQPPRPRAARTTWRLTNVPAMTPCSSIVDEKINLLRSHLSERFRYAAIRRFEVPEGARPMTGDASE